MDDIKTRLQETSKNCLEAFSTWNEKKKDKKSQEDLHAAIHELRKVSSRLEIELAISEREQSTSKPLPIPSHKSQSNGAAQTTIMDDNRSIGGNSPTIQKSSPRRRRPARKPTE